MARAPPPPPSGAGGARDGDGAGDGAADGDCAPAPLRLTAVPFSRNTTFGPADVHELVALLHGTAPPPTPPPSAAAGPGGPGGGPLGSLDAGGVIRPSRVRAMLAMRACRSSIMVGRPLDVRAMGRVLANLALLKAPWSCPHGRPTMRHLADLASVRRL